MEGIKNSIEFSGKYTRLSRKTAAEARTREKNSKARANGRLGAIRKDTDAIGMEREVVKETRAEERRWGIGLGEVREDRGTDQERGGKPGRSGWNTKRKGTKSREGGVGEERLHTVK